MIGRVALGTAAAVHWLPAIAIAQDETQEPALDCSTGPAKRTFGGTNWLVYSCGDDKTVIVISAPDSPATPFYFQFFVKDGQYKLVGEGTGNKNATDAAYDELKLLTEGDIQALIDQTRAPSGSQN